MTNDVEFVRMLVQSGVKIMRLELHSYVCDLCHHQYKTFGLPRKPYTDFLMKDTSGNLGFLSVLDNPVFVEVSALVKTNPKLQHIDSRERGAILQQVFGLACDLSPDGLVYEIEIFAPCPCCHTKQVRAHIYDAPTAIVDKDIVKVTHHTWRQLSDQQKVTKINQALDVFLRSPDALYYIEGSS